MFYSRNEKGAGQKGKKERRNLEIWINQKPQLLGKFIKYYYFFLLIFSHTQPVITFLQNVEH